jgi:hypothetical protein
VASGKAEARVAPAVGEGTAAGVAGAGDGEGGAAEVGEASLDQELVVLEVEQEVVPKRGLA